jgi:hypothetical protein
MVDTSLTFDVVGSSPAHTHGVVERFLARP